MRRYLVTVLTVLVLAAAPHAVASGDGYSDPAYREHDLENVNRSRGGFLEQATSASYLSSFTTVAAQEVVKLGARQVEDAGHGRVYGGVGWVPNFATGDPEAYRDVPKREVFFLARTGAKLSGHVWGSEAPGPRPGIVITTGGLASEQTYWWAAQALARAGYVVMTFDVQNQGSSETFARPPGEVLPSPEGSEAFRDNMNFQRAKIDALRFFLSTGDEPYVPLGWSDDDVAAATNPGERLDWINPAWGVVDRANLGVAGHSNGAFASTVIQQCSDEADLWRELEICGGRSYPIRAVVGWDRLQSTTGDYEPVVPGLDQRADYMWSADLQPDGPGDPTDVLPAYRRWRDAGLDTMLVTVRGGTHMEWNQIPFINRTTYGNDLAAYYTVAWMDRYVHPDRQVRQRGYRALLDGPVDEPERPWSANHLSVRNHSAMTLRAPRTDGAPPGRVRPAVDVTDVRSWAGRSPVGDWKGANADRQGRLQPPATLSPDVLDCTGPAPPAEPGTLAWDERDVQNMVCGEQRLLDALAHPALATPVTMPVGDPYRDPVRHDGTRFRFDTATVANGRGDQLEVEVYRPCASGTCETLPGALQTFEPPYPAVLVQHGGYQARKELHWWATQTLAEAGYMTVSLDAVHDDDMFVEDAGAVLDWFTATPDTPTADGTYNPYWGELDRDRIGMAGHSGGGATANVYGHGDERIKAIVAWDRSGRYDLPDELAVPALHLIADHGFTPVRRAESPPPAGYEGEPRPGDKWADFDQARAQGLDTMRIVLRAATHLDWVPMAAAASRHGEAVSAYYTLAWFDRYLKGQDDREVAADAFARLTADVFDDSADRHNISQGHWDPLRAAEATDPLFGGNVPYALAGMPVKDRLSFYFSSACHLRPPDAHRGAMATSDDLRARPCIVAPR